MEEVNKKLNKKKLIIVIIIIVIVIYLIINIIARMYIINKGQDIVREVLLKTINSAVENIKRSNLTYTENISELKIRIWENKDYIQGQINNLKIRGEAEFIDNQRTFYCKDGTVEEYHPNEKPCNDGLIDKTEMGGLKEFTVNGSEAIITVASESMLITMSNYPVYVLENVETSKKTTTNIISSVLDTLLYLARKVVLWQSIRNSVISSYNETTLIDRDIKEAVKAMEDFDKNMEKPTEQEINSINFKDNCIKTFKEVQNDKYNQYSQALKTSIWQKMLFIRYTVPKICDTLGNYQKKNAVKMLKSIENEENPIILIETKLYLNLMTKCSDEWMPIPGEKNSCMDTYLSEFKQNFKKSLRSEYKIGSCSNNKECANNEFCYEEQCKSGCIDSDGGKNYYKEGTVYLSTNDTLPNGEPYHQYYGFDGCNNETKVLTEYYCEEVDYKFKISSETYNCPNGCIYGWDQCA